MEQIKTLLKHCHDTFPQFGRDPEAAQTQIVTFSVTLEAYGIEDITAAFRQWLSSGKQFPLPADIAPLCAEIAKERRLKEEQHRPRIAPTPRKVTPTVPWAFKEWAAFTDADKQGLRAHLTTFDTPEARETYEKYLISWCFVPAAWFQAG